MLYIYTYLNVLINSLKEEKGQGMAEYALILAFIAVIAVAALTLLDLEGLFTGIGDSLEAAKPVPAGG